METSVHIESSDTHRDGGPVPLLHWDVVISEDNGSLLVARESGDYEIRIAGIAPDRARTLLGAFDGARPIRAAATEARISPKAASTLARRLVEEGLAVKTEIAETDTVAPLAFAAACRALYPSLKRRLFSHSLWQRLRTGAAPKPLFMG